MLEQLAELLGQDLPPSLTAATRDAHLLGMLEQAAEACAAQGERLILVVDGLDEDRGITTGQDAHSIAALLPHDPPAGMRVVVAGRPDPPIPDDVPGWHRLRDRGIIRLLAPSAYAQDIKTLAQQELKRLLRGTPAQQDLLGLLTAARGGLSGPDLAALTGEPPWEIEDILHGVSGRTFTRRVSAWQPEAGPEVYLLGHEELQATARAYLGDQRLAGYQDRLHAWAQEYRDRGWPAGTPEYLLRGYFQMLTATGDTARLVACATDAARHERMLDITGGDAAALNEVTITLDLVAAQDDPDLTAALRLARHRDYLADRNANIPTQSARRVGHPRPAHPRRSPRPLHHRPGPAGAGAGGGGRGAGQAGQHEQAAAAAWADRGPLHHDPDRQAQALAAVAGALARAGQHEQAAAVARSIPDPYRQAQALAAVAGALAEAGQHEQAAAVARLQTPAPDRQAQALAAVAGALARAGQHEQAAASGPLHHPARTAGAGAGGGGRGAGRGRPARAGRRVAAQAETVARSIPDPDRQAQALAAVAGALAGPASTSRPPRGRRGRDRGPLHHRPAPGATLAAVAEALAEAGQHEQAATVARSIPSRTGRRRRWRRWPGRWPRPASTSRPPRVAAQAETVARSIADPDPQALAAVAEGLAGPASTAGRHRGPLHHRPVPAGAGAGGGSRGAGPGRPARAGRRGSGPGRDSGPFHPRPGLRAQALAAVAGALAQAGQHEQAATVARSIPDPDSRRRRWRRWPGRWPESASTSRPPRWRPGPRPLPAPSPTRTSRRRRWRRWPRRWPGPASTSRPPR